MFFIVCPSFVFSHTQIIIKGIEHEEGFIDVKLYLNKDTFLQGDKAAESVRKIPTKGQTIIPLSNIHEGRIVVVVYHDENGDGKLNTGLFWVPKEGYAFSNNYIPKGPPSFKKAAIDLIHGEPVVIELNY